MPPYLLFLAVFFAVPTLLLGWALRRKAVRYRRTGFWLLVFVCTVGWFWDWLSVWTGVWRYDTAPTLGVWVGGLPAEEFAGFYPLSVAFMLLVSLACLRRPKNV